MRSLFSIRFVAAFAAVAALFVIAVAVIGDDDTDSTGQSSAAESDKAAESDDGGARVRKINLVEPIAAAMAPGFKVVDGVADRDIELRIDDERSVFVVEGTAGADYCEQLEDLAQCAIVADLVGEAVVWFALVPYSLDRTVVLPAIDAFEDGQAILINGWSLEYAPVLERRCIDDGDDQTREVFESYREFQEVFDDDFASIFSVDERRLTAVECRRQLDWTEQSIADSMPR